MLKQIKYISFFILAAIVAGCAASDPYIKEAEKNLKDQNFQQLLTAAEQAINNPPDDGLGYYYKAVAVGNLTQEKPADQRKDDYMDARNAFETASAAFDTLEEKPDVADRIPLIKNAFWRTEHNRAVEIVTSDSLQEAVGLGTAVSHLENATAIMPDSVLSWEVLAEVYVMNEDMDGAINAMSTAIKKLDQPEPNKFRRLALFHRNQQNAGKAAEVLEEGKKLYPNNIEITQDLTDAYLQAGKIEKGISTIQELIDRNPDNPQYRLVFGTAVYQSVLKMNSDLGDKYDQLNEAKKQLQNAPENSDEAAELEAQIAELESETEELQSEVDNLTDQAIDQLEQVMELDGQNFKAVNTLGIIYQNKAAALIEKRNNTLDNELAAEYDQEAKQMLQNASEYYEMAADIQPDNQDIWRSLFQVYTALGMTEKAQDASEKAGL